MAEIGLWHAVRGSQPTRLLEESVPLEKDLESWILILVLTNFAGENWQQRMPNVTLSFEL